MTQAKSKIKKGDQVVVITGSHKGHTGPVLSVDLKNSRIIVDGIVAKKHTKPSASSQGGIETKSASIHVSNVAHIDPKSKKPTRVGYKVEGANKTRIAKKSGEAIGGK